jgi:hypothetical protein
MSKNEGGPIGIEDAIGTRKRTDPRVNIEDAIGKRRRNSVFSDEEDTPPKKPKSNSSKVEPAKISHKVHPRYAPTRSRSGTSKPFDPLNKLSQSSDKSLKSTSKSKQLTLNFPKSPKAAPEKPQKIQESHSGPDSEEIIFCGKNYSGSPPQSSIKEKASDEGSSLDDSIPKSKHTEKNTSQEPSESSSRDKSSKDKSSTSKDSRKRTEDPFDPAPSTEKSRGRYDKFFDNIKSSKSSAKSKSQSLSEPKPLSESKSSQGLGKPLASKSDTIKDIKPRPLGKQDKPAPEPYIRIEELDERKSTSSSLSSLRPSDKVSSTKSVAFSEKSKSSQSTVEDHKPTASSTQEPKSVESNTKRISSKYSLNLDDSSSSSEMDLKDLSSDDDEIVAFFKQQATKEGEKPSRTKKKPPISIKPSARRKLRSSSKQQNLDPTEYNDLMRELDLSEDSESSEGKPAPRNKPPRVRNTLAKIYKDNQKRISEEERQILEREIKRNLHDVADEKIACVSFDMIDDQEHLATRDILDFVNQRGSDLEWDSRYCFIHWKNKNRSRELSYQSYYPKKSATDVENLLKRLGSNNSGLAISPEQESFVCGGLVQQCLLLPEIPNSVVSWLFHVGKYQNQNSLFSHISSSL